MDFIQYSVGYFVRLYCLHADAELIDLVNAPHFKAVCHILYRAFHSAACRSAYRNRLLFAHLRHRSVNHPPGSEVIEQAHHLTRGMININRAFKYQQIGVENRLSYRFKLFEVRTFGKLGIKTGVTAHAGFIKIPRQKEFFDFSADFTGKLSCRHAGASLMALSVNYQNFHNINLLCFCLTLL